MYLTYRNPHGSINPLFNVGFHAFRGFDRVFDDLFYSTGRHLDLDESDESFTLTLELPGFKQEHLSVTLEKDTLLVKAERDGRTYEQSVILPDGVDVDKIEAKLEDGILTLLLGKQAVTKPRKIAIK
jgi:HSP20 family protein